jgi:hypothetical protein
MVPAAIAAAFHVTPAELFPAGALKWTRQLKCPCEVMLRTCTLAMMRLLPVA